MNGAPDWQDGECCFRCRTQFTLVARKHHCRNCGNIFCAKCSSQQIPLPKLNIEKNVRVCDGCYDKIATKNEDPLALAIDKSSDNNDSSIKTNKSSSMNSKSSSSSNNSASSKSTSSSNKPGANASAPSEQELKEEEELQLALALSLSEAPAKISFPDCRQFEDSNAIASGSVSPGTSSSITSNHVVKNNVATQQPINQPTSSAANDQPSYVSTTPDTKQINTNAGNSLVQAQCPQELQPGQHDLEVFRFVAEVQSTSEVFTNRIKSNKLRNRPIATDSAIQSLFLKLTSMHAKLLEYIKIHDDERAGYESLQDKLSQITDARAALDALREEHQEKIRQEAAEAERQRQSQLALKLEMMRQKKSEMMQYQREIALQRIQEQEMMLRQPQGYQASNTNLPQQQTTQPVQQQSIQQQHQPQPQPPVSDMQHQAFMQQQQQQPIAQQSVFQQPGQQQHQQFIPQQLHQINNQPVAPPQPPPPKLDDEALLISFDD